MSSAICQDDDPTAVQDMKRMLEEYTANVSSKLREVRDTVRRNTPPPAASSPAPVLRVIPETRPPVFDEEPPTRRLRVAR